MLLIFLTSLIVVALSMGALALGAIAGAGPLRHGCGETTTCAGCGRPCRRRLQDREEAPWSAT